MFALISTNLSLSLTGFLSSIIFSLLLLMPRSKWLKWADPISPKSRCLHGAPFPTEIWEVHAISCECALPTSISDDFDWRSKSTHLAQSVMDPPIEDSVIGRRFLAARALSGVAEGSDSACPAANIRLLRQENTIGMSWSRSLISRLKSIRADRAKIPFAQRLRVYSDGIRFCDLLGRQYFPPTSSLISKWGTLF